ncbi:MAG: PilN domain-containing protein, partial [Patescibacteria group bacterium]
MIRLNVIGQNEKNQTDDLLRAHALFLSMLVIVGICAITVTLLVIGRAYLNIRLTSATDELASTKIVTPAGETLPVLELTKRVNAQLAVLKTQLTAFQFDTVLIDLGTATPDGVTLTAVSIETKGNTLNIQGFASSRNDVPLFEAGLKQLPYLENVSLQSNLNERTHLAITGTA